MSNFFIFLLISTTTLLTDKPCRCSRFKKIKHMNLSKADQCMKGSLGECEWIKKFGFIL